MSRRSYLLAATLLPFALVASAQPPSTAEERPEILVDTLEVEVVNIDVYVRDKGGDPVQGLQKEDFELTVDGNPIAISNFYSVHSDEADNRRIAALEKPIGSADEPPRPAESGANERLPRPPDQRLHVVIYIDNFNLTPFSRNRVLRELRAFLRTEISNGDEVMLATYDRELHLREPFSARPETVARALLDLEDISAQRIHQNSDRLDVIRRIDESETFQEAMSYADIYAGSVRNDTEFTIKALRSIVDHLAASPGRKALIYAADGLPMRAAEDVFWAVQMAWHDQMSMIRVAEYDFSNQYQELAAQANANRVAMYTIDARGLTVNSNATVDYDLKGQAGERQRIDQVLNSNLQSPLQLMAEETGGRAIINTNRYLADFRRIAQDLRSYYSLGYQSSTPGDGRYHTIKVRLTDEARGRGWKVRHRRGFRDKSLESRMHDGTLSALHLGLESNPLQARIVFGPPQATSGGLWSVPLQLRIPFDSLAIFPQEEVHYGELKLWMVAKDANDKMSDVTQIPLDISFPAAQAHRASGNDYIYPITLTMDTGYQDIAMGIQDVFGATRAFIRGGIQLGPVAN